MRYRSIRRLVGAGVVVTGLTAGVLSGSAVSGAVTHPHAVASHASSNLTVAEPPSTFPTSLLPYYTGAQCYTINIDYWNLMYRPGYWFGLGNSITEQPALSSLNQPTITTAAGQTTADFTVKPWVWSDTNAGGAGHTETMTARNVAFWLNMDKAESSGAHGTSATNSCGYSPNLGIPDNIASVSYPGGLGGNEVKIVFNKTFSSSFMLYNQLSQIQPMPTAWDETTGGGANAGACSSESFASVTTLSGDDCTNVFGFLSGDTLNDALWNWSDGPYRQTTFTYASGNPNGANVQSANTLYSGGEVAHAVKTITYVPFTTEVAEQGQLQKNALDLGYLDPNEVKTSPGPGKAGAITLTKMTNYISVGSVDYGVFYWNVNFGTKFSTDPQKSSVVWVAELNQTYIRAAIQEAINQPGVIAHIDNGYAVPSFSGVPKYPANPFSAGVTNPYPFNTTKARALLEKNGWSSATPAKCLKANCGTKAYPIKKGSSLSFTLLSPTGDAAVTQQVDEEAATIKSAGIVIKIINKGQNTVGSTCFGGTATWELCNYGGWLYAPDFYPSGEVLFLPGAGSNDGGLNDPIMNGLIDQTDFGTLRLNQKSPTLHVSYAQYSATSVPFIWQPTPAGFGIVAKSIKGAQPPNPLGDFNPEYITAI